MGKNLVIFFLTFALAFGGGYLFYQSQAPEEAATETKAEQPQAEQPAAETATETATVSGEGEILVSRGCTACHAVSALGVDGGATGPDLSNAYVNVGDKHGVPIEEFLKKPTSAVMSGVLGGKPLTDEELQGILAALKTASEK